MSVTHFVPAPGHYGETYLSACATLPTTVISAAGTARHYLPMPAAEVTLGNQKELLYYKGGALTFGGTASSTSGAVTARVVKRNSAGTITALSSTVTIPSGTGTGSILAFPILTTATDNDKTLRPNDGDTIAVEVTQAGGGSVSTQPANVTAAVKLAVLR